MSICKRKVRTALPNSGNPFQYPELRTALQRVFASEQKVCSLQSKFLHTSVASHFPVKKNSFFVMFCSVVLCAPLAWSQTFEINGQQTQPSATSPNGSQPRAKKGAPSAGATSDNGIGWGSSIEVGRLARAAEDALRHGNPGQAADYAAARGKGGARRQQALVPAGLHLAHGRPLSAVARCLPARAAEFSRQSRRHERVGADLRRHGTHRPGACNCCNRSSGPILIAPTTCWWRASCT